MDEKETLHNCLIVTLMALAQTKAAQLAYTAGGCSVCDLVEDLETYGQRCYETSEHSLEENEAMDTLHRLVKSYCTLGLPCFDESALDHIEWQNIRESALYALHQFGYVLTPLPECVEKNGVWSVDLANHPLQRL